MIWAFRTARIIVTVAARYIRRAATTLIRFQNLRSRIRYVEFGAMRLRLPVAQKMERSGEQTLTRVWCRCTERILICRVLYLVRLSR